MRLLLLAGTREARDLSFALKGVDLVSSLAGMTARPAKLGGEMRIGGFGGVDGLVGYLQEGSFDAVIDATHPFAVQMSQNAHEACRICKLPLLQVIRPAWELRPNWTRAASLADAAEMLPTQSHVFLATGRASLQHFAGREDVEFTTRVIDDLSGAFPLKNGRFLVSKPPFSVEEEMKTLKDLNISVLVARNSGGTGGIEKVLAADQLGVEVVMVERPELPDAMRVASVDEALKMMETVDWLDA